MPFWCCLPYKGTNFSANHNLFSFCCQRIEMLFTLQRYEFFSKSQLFFARIFFENDVVYPTKVRIFQQITTHLLSKGDDFGMLFTLQRYEFFSKSQQNLKRIFSIGRCCLPYKGTNFSANHNKVDRLNWCKQMLFTLQRYEFFSKSQPLIFFDFILTGCCLPYKGTNFSANHNGVFIKVVSCCDVVYPTKVRIFQQITTMVGRHYYLERCCLPYKGTNFSANHNASNHLLMLWKDVVYPTKVRIFQQITTPW